MFTAYIDLDLLLATPKSFHLPPLLLHKVSKPMPLSDFPQLTTHFVQNSAGTEDFCGLLNAVASCIWPDGTGTVSKAHIIAFNSIYLALPDTTNLRQSLTSLPSGVVDQLPSFKGKSPFDKLQYCTLYVPILEACAPNERVVMSPQGLTCGYVSHDCDFSCNCSSQFNAGFWI